MSPASDGASANLRDDVARQAPTAATLIELDELVSRCRACPRLVSWREKVATERRRSFADEVYWGRPVPGFGDAGAAVLIVGLAPAAHGANRTGRMFTGDRSGDWLYASLHRVGAASQPTSTGRDDGLSLTGVRITAAVRCAPPDNAPTVDERDTCAPWLDAELALLPAVRTIVALGGFAWSAALRALDRAGEELPRPKPRFAHGAEVGVGTRVLLGSYHPSQQNTFTGRLTEPMLDAVLGRALELAGLRE